VLRVKSITIGRAILGPKRVPILGVLSSSRSFFVIYSTKASAVGDLGARGSY